jgi:hypothetical protein
MIYVYRNGELVEKRFTSPGKTKFPSPRVSRFDAFESPVTGQSISSWRQRERDMNAVDAVDRRDLPQAAFSKRKRIEERNAGAGKT